MLHVVGSTSTTGSVGTFTVAPVPGGGFDLLSVSRQVARFRTAEAAIRFAERTYGETATVVDAIHTPSHDVKCRKCGTTHPARLVTCSALTADQRRIVAAQGGAR